MKTIGTLLQVTTVLTTLLPNLALAKLAPTNAYEKSEATDVMIYDQSQVDTSMYKNLVARSKGPGGTGGGDDFTLDFITTATLELPSLLRTEWKNKVPHMKIDEIEKTLDPSKIRSAKKVYESCDESNQGREVVVCFNKNTKEFVISRSLYPINQSSIAKIKLVAHEIFRKLGLEGDGYELTRSFFAPVGFVGSQALNQPQSRDKSPESIPENLVQNYLDISTAPRGTTSSDYSALSAMLKKSAIQRTQVGLKTVEEVNQIVAEWAKEQMRKSNKGVIEIKLPEMQYRNDYKRIGSGTSGYSSYSGDGSSYTKAYIKALDASLNSTGMGVLTVGGFINSSINKEVDILDGLVSGGSSTQAFAFVGVKPGAEVQLANYAFKVMTFAQGLETMGRVYEQALANIENQFKNDLQKRGVKLDAAAYFTELNQLYAKADIKFTATMFQDLESQKEFLTDLEKLVSDSKANEAKSAKKFEDTKLESALLKDPSFTRHPYWQCRYVNETHPWPGVAKSKIEALAIAKQNCYDAQMHKTYSCPEVDATCYQKLGL